MKQNNLLNNGETSHTAGADKLKGESMSPNTKKFKDVESLCKAYGFLQAEFTKRCQQNKKLVRENIWLKSLVGEEKLKQLENEKSGDNGLIAPLIAQKDGEILEKTTQNDDEIKQNIDIILSQNDSENFAQIKEEKQFINPQNQNMQSENFTSEPEKIVAKEGVICTKNVQPTTENSQENLTLNMSDERENLEDKLDMEKLEADVLVGKNNGVIFEFFNRHPSASKYAQKIGAKILDGQVTFNNLQDAFISILLEEKNSVPQKIEGENYQDLPNNIKDDIIKNYLLSLKAEAQKPGLMGGGGVIPVIPPVKPKTIAEASALAKNMIKFK